jgi:hypothetical protein
MSSSVRYAQARRDSEKRACDQLSTVIPQNYIDDVPEADPKDNQTTKLVKATFAYVSDIVSGGAGTDANTMSTPQRKNTKQVAAQVCWCPPSSNI